MTKKWTHNPRRSLFVLATVCTPFFLAPWASGESEPSTTEAMVEKLQTGAPISAADADLPGTLRLLSEIGRSHQDESIRAKANETLRKVVDEHEQEEVFGDALGQAIGKGDITLVKDLLAGPFSANIRTSGKHWSTPLHHAIGTGNDEIVRELLIHGADPDSVDYMGYRPIFKAIEKGNQSIVNALLDRGAPLDGFTHELPWGGEFLPLTCAVNTGSLDMVNMLLSRGADVNADPGVGASPLLAACGVPPKVSILARLLEAGADVNGGHNRHDGNPLIRAAHGLHEPEASRAAVRLLLDHGADTRIADRTGRTALHWTMMGKSAEIPSLLIDAGAKVNRADHFGFTPYGYATAIGNVEMMELLKAKKARTEGVGFRDDESLHRAVVRGDLDAVKKLVEAGADVTRLSENRWTPLHAAAFCAYMLVPDITALLLAHGADPNSTGAHGWTPLHVASLCGDNRFVRDLLKAGGDPALKDDDGNTPHDLASRSRAFSIAKAIERHAAAARK